jgi:SAM-dependent methyltransferase
MLSPIFYTTIRSQAEFQAFYDRQQSDIAARVAYEETLLQGGSEFVTEGYCCVCQKRNPLRVDLLWSDGKHPNWRERLVCCSCGLNNRIRASWHFLELIAQPSRDSKIYITEQATPLFSLLRERFDGVIGSEFLGAISAKGKLNDKGIRHEDITDLTFPTGLLDCVLSFDVLEHVPDFAKAFSELARVLRPGGHLIATFPFDAAAAGTRIRASISDVGTIIHHEPPEYHGDPLSDDGCLCFQVFGWDLMEQLRKAGFSDASAICYWSSESGYLGGGYQLIFHALR